jgi:hypothetical protein
VRAPLLSSPYAYVFDLTRPAQLLVARYRPTPKILAAFVMNQWHSLNWPIPDIVVPIRQTREIAKVFAAWLEIPSIPLLSSASNNWHCATDRVEEDLIYLLLVWDQSVEELEQILSALSEVFPKKVYILSLF